LSYFFIFLQLEFVARVFAGGKVTVPKQLRERFGVEDGDYVRLVLVEVFEKSGNGEWVMESV
jgi:bifunctional DNA-binding transcriptional regulator/antitoxin component of YhaV-PrlF toxin-antitoxin module